MTRIRYIQIADEIRAQIATGELAAGEVLPSEATLGRRHTASRVTIRKALESLREDGLVESRQGFGWSVSADTVPQVLDDLVTIEDQLGSTGRLSQRRVLDFRFVTPSPEIAAELGSTVLEVRRLNLADGRPFARVTVWCREDLAAPLSRDEVEERSFLELIDGQVAGAVQRIGARAMGSVDADLLDVPVGSPALVVSRVTHDDLDQPILVSEHVFPGHLTEFVAELSPSAASHLASPAGLRLVDD